MMSFTLTFLVSLHVLIWLNFPNTGPKEFAALWGCLGQWRVSSLFLFLLSRISFLYIAFEDARHLNHSMLFILYNTEERLNMEEDS
jgi:hypothetical protein